MNKQMVNLIGALGSLLIVVLGVVVFALPLFSSANTTAASAVTVASQNRAQQTVLDTLTAQAADMTELDDAVDELRAEIPEAAHLDDVLLLAVRATTDHGGVVTSVTPATAEAFAPRTGETDAATAATPDPAADPAASDAAADAASDPASDRAEQQQIAVTVVVEAEGVEAATRILDALRDGPRVVTVTQATVTSAPEGGATLTATLLAFFRA